MLPVGPAEASCPLGGGGGGASNHASPAGRVLLPESWLCFHRCQRAMETEFVEEIDRSSFIFASPKWETQQASASRTVPPLLGIRRGFISS